VAAADLEGRARLTLEAVRKALGAESRVDLAHHHLALALDGEALTMEGEVEGVGAKRLALERAAAVPGVRFIVDRLRVRPARAMTDAEIRDHLCHSLLAEPAFAGHAVRCRRAGRVEALREPAGGAGELEVEVEAGVVTLSGEVPGLGQKRLAGVLAWWVPGSRDVVNGLEVRPAEGDTEGELADAVRLSLEKDPLVDASGIRVAVRGTVVTLSGVVSSRAQREMAEADAWYVFGVDDVRNEIEATR